MRQRIKFTDERVCKSHLLESCPHDILSGTVSVPINTLCCSLYVRVSKLCLYAAHGFGGLCQTSRSRFEGRL